MTANHIFGSTLHSMLEPLSLEANPTTALLLVGEMWTRSSCAHSERKPVLEPVILMRSAAVTKARHKWDSFQKM